MAGPYPMAARIAQKPGSSPAAPARAVKAAAGKGSFAGPRSRLQFLLDIAQFTFSSESGPPTTAQIEALRRTLSAVPLEELGMAADEPLQQPGSDVSSRSSSPSLSDGTHALLAQERSQSPLADDSQLPRPPITYLLIYEDAQVSLGIFCLPARARIPLHNHPGMTVMSRVLYGRMHVCSYDWADGQPEGSGSLPREARRVMDATLGAGDPPAVLFPKEGGNIHQFTAAADCAVLDLMSPPYSTEDGRDCTYYTVVEGAAPTAANASIVLLDSFEPPADFVINQGEYRGMTPRPKPLPSLPVPTPQASERSREASPTGSGGNSDASGQQHSDRERQQSRAEEQQQQGQAGKGAGSLLAPAGAQPAVPGAVDERARLEKPRKGQARHAR